MTPHVVIGTSPYRSARAADSTPASAVVHVVDVDDELRLSLLHALAAFGMELQAHTHLDAFLGAHRAERPGCLVIDARSIGASPMPFAMRYPIVVIASKGDLSVVVSAMKAGAVDVVEKPPCERKLAAAVAEAIEIDRRRRLVESRHAEVHASFATLTPRERQVMALVTAGRLNKQVGAELGVCEITVKAHRGSAMRKMGARSLADLVRMADALGETLASTPRSGSSPPARNGAGEDRRSGCIQDRQM